MSTGSASNAGSSKAEHDAPYEWQHLPGGIYFDTNSLISAGFALDRPWLTELRASADELGIRLFVPELVFQEWSRKFKEHVREQTRRLRSAAGTLRSFGVQAPELPDSLVGETEEALEQYTSSLFEKADLHRIETPPLNLAHLLQDAVGAIAPFENGDKGFRDAVIVESIGHHAFAEAVGRVMMVSADAAVRNAGPRFAKHGIEAAFCDAHNAPIVLDELLEKEHDSLKKHRDAALEQLVNHESGRVIEYVRRAKLSLSDWQLRGGYSEKQDLYGSIRAVRSVVPRAIAGVSAFLRPLRTQLSPDRLGFSVFVTVDIELELEVSEGGTGTLAALLHQLEVTPSKVSAEDPVLVPTPEFKPYGTRRIVRVVERSLTVDASVDAEKARDGQYRDLQLHAVH